MKRNALLLLASALTALPLAAQTARSPFGGPPDATVDLATKEGASLLSAQWRYRDAKVVDVESKGVGADLKPSGAPVKTYDVEPKAGGSGFDDSSWDRIEPTALDARRGNGRVSFAWYRTTLTIPERIGGFDPTGSTAVFEVVVDDYAEVWVDGQLPVVLGQRGGAVVTGFNAPNRLVIGRNVKPGQRIQLAVFGMNGPISKSPANFIWIKSATVDFFRPRGFNRPGESFGTVDRRDPALDAIVPPGAVVEKLAEGFLFVEGPVWSREGGFLLFSDPNNNRIYRWTPDGDLSIFRTKSGYTGADIAQYGQPGSNGLTFDREGRLTIDEHGNRRVTRLEKNGQITVLADRYDGKRLNSPNDLVYRSDGTLYVTDPPFGLPKFFDDPRKELPYSGVYAIKDGKVRLLAKELTGPNGLAFTPDEKFLYVDNWDEKRKVVMRYEVKPDGSLGTGSVFFDMGGAPEKEALDGLKVDQQGNVYVSGPGGLWILSPSGKHLGTLEVAELPANFAWGDDDGKTLYMTARTGLYRIRLNVAGIRP